MSEAVAVTPREDRSLFSLHPEDEMTEHEFHDRQLHYSKHALGEVLPGLYIARNMAVYWVPGQRQNPYAGPDLFVARGHPVRPNPSCYLTYEDGPLMFVMEVASESTRAMEGTKRDETYAVQLTVPEHLYIDGDRHELVLSALVGSRYETVEPDEQGRHWSRELRVGFVWQDDGRLVRVVTPDGQIVASPQEDAALRREAEERALRETRRAARATQRARLQARRAEDAESRAVEEARQRAEAEARAVEEARHRAEAEARAVEEARHRAEAEARTHEEARRRSDAETRLVEEAGQRAEAVARAEALALEVERLRRTIDGDAETRSSS
jgi:Uma2 family endonuclease